MIDWTLGIAPLVQPWLIAGLGGLGVMISILAIWQRGLRGIWRLAGIGALLAVLVNPVIEARDTEPLADIAVIVVDESASQSLKPRPGQIARAKRKLADIFKATPNLETRWVTVKSRAGSSGTRLVPALANALRDIPPERYAGAIVITDGQLHDTDKTLKSQSGRPVHVLLTGRPGERDRRLIVTHAPKFGIVGENVTIAFRVEEELKTDTRSIAVTLRRDGAPERTIKARPGETIRLKLKIGHAGLNVIELIAQPGPNELTTRNNRALISVTGIRDRLRVLLVSGEPHQGERTWRNLLKADASVDLIHFTILRPPEKQDGTPIMELSLIAFPTRELFAEKLHQFDLVIFDRYRRRGVLPLVYFSNVADYVQKGGAVLAAAGPAFASPFSLYRTPLASILPGMPTGSITAAPYRPRVTSKGLRHPVTSDLPGAADKISKWGKWFRLIDTEPTGGVTLMSGAGEKPLLMLRRHGSGRVALLLSDHAWLWARGYDGGGPYAELLRRLAHWLMKEPDLEEERLIARQGKDRLTIERRTMSDKAAPVTLTAPSGKSRTLDLRYVRPGVWRTTVKTSETGLYKLRSGKISAVVALGLTDLKEWSDVRSSDKVVRPLMAATGGGIHRLWRGPAKAAELPKIRFLSAGRRMSGSGWLALRRNNATRTISLRSIPLFGLPAAIAALLALLGLVWFREGR